MFHSIFFYVYIAHIARECLTKSVPLGSCQNES